MSENSALLVARGLRKVYGDGEGEVAAGYAPQRAGDADEFAVHVTEANHRVAEDVLIIRCRAVLLRRAFAGVHIERGNIATKRRELRAGVADEHLAVRHARRAGDRVRLALIHRRR